MRMMKRVGLPRNAALDALTLFDAMHGEHDCDALTIYLAICEAAFTISLEGTGGDTLLMNNFADVIRGTDSSKSTLAQGILSARMCLAARESAETRQFITL